MDPASSRNILAARRAAIVDEWLAETLKTYPAETSRFLGAEADRFRNPAGHALRENLAALFDAVMLSDDWERAARALGELVQLRAVQDFTPARAVGFILPLKTILRNATSDTADAHEREAACQAIEQRIDRLVGLASQMYAKCRARMAELSLNEARRRTWLAERIRHAVGAQPLDCVRSDRAGSPPPASGPTKVGPYGP